MVFAALLASTLVYGGRLDSLLAVLEERLVHDLARELRSTDTCTPRFSVPRHGKCMETRQCEFADVTATAADAANPDASLRMPEGTQKAYCCPYLKLCLQGVRDSPPSSISPAVCEPRCHDATGESCRGNCENPDFPDNWAAPTCPSGYVAPTVSIPTKEPTPMVTEPVKKEEPVKKDEPVKEEMPEGMHKCDTKAALGCVDMCSHCVGCEGDECRECGEGECGICGREYQECFPPPSTGVDCSSPVAETCVRECGACMDPQICPMDTMGEDCPMCMSESCSCLNDYMECAYEAAQNGAVTSCPTKKAQNCVDMCSYCMTCSGDACNGCDADTEDEDCGRCGYEYQDCFPMPEVGSVNADCASLSAQSCVSECGDCVTSPNPGEYCYSSDCGCLNTYFSCALMR